MEQSYGVNIVWLLQQKKKTVTAAAPDSTVLYSCFDFVAFKAILMLFFTIEDNSFYQQLRKKRSSE